MVDIEIKDLTFDNLEDMIFEISQNIGRKVFEKAITDIDNYLCHKREGERDLKTPVKEKNNSYKALSSHMACGMINKL